MAGFQGVAAKLLDPNTPMDIGLLDSVVNAFYSAASAPEVCREKGTFYDTDSVGMGS